MTADPTVTRTARTPKGPSARLIGAFLLCILGTAGFTSAHARRTLEVGLDGTYPFQEIQAAIDAADDGDSVVVAAGTYFENLRLDAAIELVANGIVTVRADTMPPTDAPILTITGTQHPIHTPTVAGFTFQGGTGLLVPALGGRAGGGVLIDSGVTVRLVRCRIDSSSADWGGGVAVLGDATARLVQGVIADNSALAGGGGLYVEGSAIIDTLVVEGNLVGGGQGSSAGGGGLYVRGAVDADSLRVARNGADRGAGGVEVAGIATLDSLLVEQNEGDRGGGIGVGAGGTLTLSSARIEGNTARTAGGGIAVVGAADIDSVRIAGNAVRDPNLVGDGGGLHAAAGAVVTARRIEVLENAAERGGGLAIESSSTTITRALVAGNEAASRGGGVYASADATLEFLTIDSNIAVLGGGAYVDAGTPAIRNSIVSRNAFSDFVCGGAELAYNDRWQNQPNELAGCPLGPGSIVIDPLFVGGDPFDYRLSVRSPCIDAADPVAEVPAGGGTRADIGAYEFPQGPTILSATLEGAKRWFTNGDEVAVKLSGIADPTLTVTATGDFTSVDPSCGEGDVEARASSFEPPATFAFRVSCTLGSAAGVDSNLAIYVIARTSLGGSSRDSVRINIDAQPPLRPLLDALPSGTANAVLPVTGRATEADGTPADSVVVVLNGVRSRSAGAPVDAGGRFSAQITLSERTNTITAVAFDGAGNESDPSSEQTVAFTGAFFVEVPKRFTPGASFTVGAPGAPNEVTVTIVNLAGQVIRVLNASGDQLIEVEWNGTNNAGAAVNAGPYIARIEHLDRQSGARRTEHRAFVFMKGATP